MTILKPLLTGLLLAVLALPAAAQDQEPLDCGDSAQIRDVEGNVSCEGDESSSVQVRNDLQQGAINANIYKDGKLL